jgi:hypothetical protein
MSRIRGKDTTPEKRVRSLLHKMGFRFRLHVKIPVPSEISRGIYRRKPRAQRARTNLELGI